MIAVAGAGALFSALLCLILDERTAGALWLPHGDAARLRDRTGRYKRIADMVEIRPVQTAAEERVRSAFDR